MKTITLEEAIHLIQHRNGPHKTQYIPVSNRSTQVYQIEGTDIQLTLCCREYSHTWQTWKYWLEDSNTGNTYMDIRYLKRLLKRNQIEGKKWGDLTKSQQTAFLAKSNVSDTGKSGKFLVDSGKYTVAGTVIETEYETLIEINDDAVIYDPAK